MVKQKRRLQKGAALALSLLLLLGSLAGCGGKPQEDTSGVDGPTNTYTPPVNEDGYIVVEIPVTLMGGNSAEDLIAEFQNSEQYNHEGEVAPMERITDITANADGSVNYIFLPEQFETYKTQLFDAGRFQYAFGEFPSIQGAEYTEIDGDGIPWAVVTFVDKADYEASQPITSLYATVWPATYLGQYQIFCGVPGDEWAVHVTVKDTDSGEVISEHDFPTRDE